MVAGLAPPAFGPCVLCLSLGLLLQELATVTFHSSGLSCREVSDGPRIVPTLRLGLPGVPPVTVLSVVEVKSVALGC